MHIQYDSELDIFAGGFDAAICGVESGLGADGVTTFVVDVGGDVTVLCGDAVTILGGETVVDVDTELLHSVVAVELGRLIWVLCVVTRTVVVDISENDHFTNQKAMTLF